MENQKKKYIQLTLVTICSIIFIFILWKVLGNDIDSFDKSVYKFISNFMHEPITNIVKILTNLGGAIFIIVTTIIIVMVCKDKKYGIYIVTNLAIVTIINQIIKFMIHRPRPDILLRLIEEHGYSFPSGHSMVSMAFYGLLVYFAYIKIENKYLKWITCSFLCFIVIAIGISRIYLGVHYASDVIAGFLLGIVYLYVFIRTVVNI